MALRTGTSLITGLFILALTWRAVQSQVEVNMEDRVEVFLKDTAQITCMFTSSEGVGGTMISWYMMQGEERRRISYWDSVVTQVDRDTPLTGRVTVNGTVAAGELVLTIRDVQLGDETAYVCVVASLTEGSGEGRTNLRVFETPELPSIEGVHAGISVTNEGLSKIGSCQARNGYPQPNITWYRDQTPLNNKLGEVTVVTQQTVESSGLVTLNSELQLQVVKKDRDATFYCEVSYTVPGGTRMTETNRINITVYYPTTALTVWVESPKRLIKEGDTVEIRCRGNGHPQPPLTFFYDETELANTEDGLVVLQEVTRLHMGTYVCQSFDVDTYEEITNKTELSINYLDPAVLSPKDVGEYEMGEEVSVTCNALSSLPTHTAWFKNGELVAEGHLLKMEAGLESSGTYVCVVTVPDLEGLETSGAIRISVHGPPVITEPQETILEENLDASVTLTCQARGYPTPTLTWTASDSQVLKEVSHDQTEDEVTSVISVKVTSDLTVHCHAVSSQGNDSQVFRIKAISHTSPPAPPTTTTPSTTTTTTATAISGVPGKKVKKEGSGVIIAVIIICLLLLAVLGSVLYFLYKKGKISCGRSGKQDITKEKATKEGVVVEMKSENNEEAVLLQVNGEKKPPGDQ